MLPMFVVIATFVFTVAAICWGRKDWFNLTIKVLLTLLSLYGLFVTATISGYIIKVN